jgi:hypothetical protein
MFMNIVYTLYTSINLKTRKTIKTRKIRALLYKQFFAPAPSKTPTKTLLIAKAPEILKLALGFDYNYMACRLSCKFPSIANFSDCCDRNILFKPTFLPAIACDFCSLTLNRPGVTISLIQIPGRLTAKKLFRADRP